MIVEYQKLDSDDITNNFTASEFACKGKNCCHTTKIDGDLVNYLQKIRDHFGKPVKIGSGYRCPTYNSRVKNASKKSKHMLGMAADISIKGVAPSEIAKYAESIGVKGIGLYTTFVHIDTRTTKSFWYSHAQKPRATFGGAPIEGYSEKEFIKDIQKAIGAKVDGIAGPDTLSKTVTVSSKINRDHAVVKCIQKRLKELGYNEIGNIDGVAGSMFTSAVAHFQQDTGCAVDGVITAKKQTWKKLLGLA